MKDVSLDIMKPGEAEAVARLQEAAGAKKCWRCGCLHHSLAAIEKAIPMDRRSTALAVVIEEARQRLVPVQYDCLGCEVCFPPLAMNALQINDEACPNEKVDARAGWPPLPGSYSVLQFHAPVALCTLTDEKLAGEIASQHWPDVSIVGIMYTENLGIERVVENVVTNANIRFLILCGPDSRQTIGHLPGKSMLALARSGLDAGGRILGAKGKRPIVRNIGRDTVEHFRHTVEVVDLIGVTDLTSISQAVSACKARSPGPAAPWISTQNVPVISGYKPEKMVSDPAGYFIVYVDRPKRKLLLEHYQNTGVLDVIVEGTSAAEIYIPVIERQFISRLDHAAYLGRELARAEFSLGTGEPYVQDAAPEARSSLPETDAPSTKTSSCGCGPEPKENKR